MEIEKFKMLIHKHRYDWTCNACPNKVRMTYVLRVGDTSLIRLCTKCKARLKRAVNARAS